MADFFRNEKERNLWLKIQAEFLVEFQKKVNHWNDYEMGSIDKPNTAMYVANNQLEYDEKNGSLRISLEQLLTFTYPQYEAHLRQKHKEYCEKHFTLR